MEIRTYKDEDWIPICEIYLKGRKDELIGICDLNKVLSLDKTPDKLHKFNAGYKYIYELGGKVVGFICVNESEISLLYVDDNSRLKGIGRKLLRAGKLIVGEKAYLEVSYYNKKAKKLYSSEGFNAIFEFHPIVYGIITKGINMQLKQKKSDV
jgi:ribosomal protein S18 acetylase RimI-like enzyme